MRSEEKSQNPWNTHALSDDGLISSPPKAKTKSDESPLYLARTRP